MKRSGCRMSLADERAKALLTAYRKYIDRCRHIDPARAFAVAANSPSPRFWVSDYRAAVVVSAIISGKDISSMHPLKQKMYREIFQRALPLINKGMPLKRAVAIVVQQPAPSFYLTHHSAKSIILQARKNAAIRRH